MGHLEAGRLGQGFKLGDFGGDLHERSMCTRAPMSSADRCTDGQSHVREGHGITSPMAQPRSEAAKEYRRQVAAYLQAVMIARSLDRKQMGAIVGRVSHSTMSRWLNEKVDADYGDLTLIAKETGIPLPDALNAAFANTRDQPGRVELRAALDRRQKALERLEGLTPDEEDALLQSLLARRRG